MTNIELIPFIDSDPLAQAVARAWVDEIATAQKAGRSHHVALSGGRITLKFFAAAIESFRARNLSPTNVHFFWADERCVPPTDKESSFGAANEAFFRPLNIAAENIHRVHGELPLAEATTQAIAEIRKHVPMNAAGQPVFDLIFLGMGEDGHVASLFPDEPEAERLNPAICRPITNSPKPPANRVTLGYPCIAAAKQVWVLASGSGKEQAFQASLASEGKTPLGRVLQLRRHTKVFTDIKTPSQD